MSKYQFQFQYDPIDMKAIRDASGVFQFSPSVTITIWAIGFAICLLILGAIGAWTVLAVLFVMASLFIAFYVYHLGKKRFADREYHSRTVNLSSNSVLEEFGNSMFQTSWNAFHSFEDTVEHFVLQHYEKITAIPKRVIPDKDIDDCRDFIHQRMSNSEIQELDLFHQWMSNNGPFAIYSFRWRNDDFAKLNTTRMQGFGESEHESSVKSDSVIRMLSAIVLLVIVAATIFFLNDFLFYDGRRMPLQLLLFTSAISIPFIFALIWHKFADLKMRNKKPRIPSEAIRVTVSQDALLIGHPLSVARYSWQDMAGFCHSDDFIGFRTIGGSVRVIANHAFGDKEEALEFLRLADALRTESLRSNSDAISSNANSIETGNPFQSPRNTA